MNDRSPLTGARSLDQLPDAGPPTVGAPFRLRQIFSDAPRAVIALVPLPQQ